MDKRDSKNSIEETLSKVTLIGQVSGLQYFSVNSESLRATSGVSRRHKIFLFFNFIFFVGLLILMAFLMYFRLTKDQRSGVKTGHIMQLIVCSLVIVVASVPTINNFLLRSKAKGIFKNCFRISEILFVLNQSADYTSFERECRMTLARLFFGWILSNTRMMIVACQRNSLIVLLLGMVSVYSYVVVTVLVSYWTILIRLISENLKFIRDCLVHLHKRHKMFSLHPETYNLDLRIRRTQEMYNFIGKLKTMYVLAHDSTSRLNELIGIPICVLIVFVVVSNISGGYKIFLAICGYYPFLAIAGKIDRTTRLSNVGP